MPPVGKSRTAIDASVAVPLLSRDHVSHRRVRAWHDAAGPTVICGHAMLETFSVLTRLPGEARVTAADAWQLIATELGEPIVPTAATWRKALARLSQCGLAGGATYDGWIAMTAVDHGHRLATLDARALVTYRSLGTEVVLIASNEGT